MQLNPDLFTVPVLDERTIDDGELVCYKAIAGEYWSICEKQGRTYYTQKSNEADGNRWGMWYTLSPLIKEILDATKEE